MLKGKIAFVTGGSRGIGRAVCLALASAGADVAFCSRSAGEAVDETLALLRETGVRCAAYTCDVADYDQVAATVSQVLADFGTVDILVNNAGVTCDKLLLSMKPEEFDRVIRTNLYGVFHTVKQLYPVFCKKRAGRIINISSVSGVIGNAGQANYAASKAAVIGFTKSIAKELAARNVTCNAVAPGFVETDLTASLDSEALRGQIPLKRFGKAEEIGSLVAYLASDDAGYITGSVFTADGGLTCC